MRSERISNSTLFFPETGAASPGISICNSSQPYRKIETAQTRKPSVAAFVQLEYFGYMKRDPDESGYAFWPAKLNQFGGNFVNAEMVLAFTPSPEYRARFGQP